METTLERYCSFTLPTLQKICQIKIVTTLCNNPMLLSPILECKLDRDYTSRLYARRGRKWKAVQTVASEMITKIHTATKLRHSTMELLWPVGCRIIMWKSKYGGEIENQFLHHFCWTSQGRIDAVKTAKPIVRNSDISIKGRFILACCVGLVEDVRKLLKEMTSYEKKYFLSRTRLCISPLLGFWVRVIEGTEDDLKHFWKNACLCTVKKGLLGALEYLFTLTTYEAVNTMAVTCMEQLNEKLYQLYLEEDDIHIGYFLFSVMNDKSRELLFQLPALEIVLLFHYSERKHFFNVLSERLHYFIDDDIIALLYQMFFDYHFEVTQDDDCRKVFFDLWLEIPDSIKNYIAHTEVGGQFLCVLIRDNFPFLVRKEEYKKTVVLSSKDLRLIDSVTPFGLYQNKWEFVNFIIKENVVRVPILKEYKLLYTSILKLHKTNIGAWKHFLLFVGEIVGKKFK